MRLSKSGLICGCIYLALAASLFLVASLFTDDKGVYVFRQLAVWPCLMLVAGIGAATGSEKMLFESWVNTFPAMLLLNFGLAYGAGWAAQRLLHRTSERRDQGLER